MPTGEELSEGSATAQDRTGMAGRWEARRTQHEAYFGPDAESPGVAQPGYPSPQYPQVPTAPAAPMPRVDPTFAWTLAASPLLVALLPYALPSIDSTDVFGIAVVTNSVLAIADQVRLDRVGIKIHALLALFLVPVYLIVRTMRAKSTPAIPVLWFVALLASFVIDNAVAANRPVTMDGPRVERQLVTAIRAEYDIKTRVDCPFEPSVNIGDSFPCDVTASDGSTATVYVTVTDAEGRYRWTLTQ